MKEKIKASGQHLVLIYFSRPRLGHTIKTKFTFQTVDPEICSILISHAFIYLLTKFNCLVAFTS